MFTIKRLGKGWYSFKDLPQGYIKIDCLRCGDDKKAIKQAERIVGKDKQIVII